jgi:hypothetical protein
MSSISRPVKFIPGLELARRHNALGPTGPLPETATSCHGRPFRVMTFYGLAGGLLAQIRDSRDLLSNPQWRPWLRAL